MIDLRKMALVQDTTTTRSVAVTGKTAVIALTVDSADGLELIATLQLYKGGKWSNTFTWTYPNPAVVNINGNADRLRVVLDPSRPVSIGVTLWQQ